MPIFPWFQERIPSANEPPDLKDQVPELTEMDYLADIYQCLETVLEIMRAQQTILEGIHHRLSEMG